MPTLTLSAARLADGRRVDVRIVDGVIESVERTGAGEPGIPSDSVVECGGRLLTPSLVNGHAHLDKTFMGGTWQPHRPGTTVRERVAAERDIRASLDAPIIDRARTLASALLAEGTTSIRTHVDIDAELELLGLEAVLALREEFAGSLDLQVVAFPQSGILHEPGVAGLLEAAVRDGADVVGGLDPTGFDGDATAHLDVVFSLAERYDRAVDIHLHDLGELGIAQILDIAARTRSAGLGGRATISHAYSLGSVGVDRVREVADALATAGVSIMTNGPTGPMPDVRVLREHGVTVFSGSDNIRDAWWPYGSADMLDVARTVAYQSDFRTDDELAVALDLVTGSAARALGDPEHAIGVGHAATVMLLDCETPAEAVVASPDRLLVLTRGVPVAGSWRSTVEP